MCNITAYKPPSLILWQRKIEGHRVISVFGLLLSVLPSLNKAYYYYYYYRLGRVKIVTLRVITANSDIYNNNNNNNNNNNITVIVIIKSLQKKNLISVLHLLTCLIFSSLLEFQHGSFASKTFVLPKKTLAQLQASVKCSAKNPCLGAGCKESQFYSLPFRRAVASMYWPTSHFNLTPKPLWLARLITGHPSVIWISPQNSLARRTS